MAGDPETAVSHVQMEHTAQTVHICVAVTQTTRCSVVTLTALVCVILASREDVANVRVARECLDYIVDLNAIAIRTTQRMMSVTVWMGRVCVLLVIKVKHVIRFATLVCMGVVVI